MSGLVPMDATHTLTSHEGLGRLARNDGRVGLQIVRVDRKRRILPPHDEPAASLGGEGVLPGGARMCFAIRTPEARRCLEEP